MGKAKDYRKKISDNEKYNCLFGGHYEGGKDDLTTDQFLDKYRDLLLEDVNGLVDQWDITSDSVKLFLIQFKEQLKTQKI